MLVLRRQGGGDVLAQISGKLCPDRSFLYRYLAGGAYAVCGNFNRYRSGGLGLDRSGLGNGGYFGVAAFIDCLFAGSHDFSFQSERFSDGQYCRFFYPASRRASLP